MQIGTTPNPFSKRQKNATSYSRAFTDPLRARSQSGMSEAANASDTVARIRPSKRLACGMTITPELSPKALCAKRDRDRQAHHTYPDPCKGIKQRHPDKDQAVIAARDQKTSSAHRSSANKCADKIGSADTRRSPAACRSCYD
jgi:hypothetical protein